MQDGIAQAVKHYTKANNKYIKNQYSPDEKNTRRKQPLRVGNDPKTTNDWVFLWEIRNSTPQRPDKLIKKISKGIF